MTQLAPYVINRQWNNSGRVLAAGRIYTYRTKTTTPLETYQDLEGNILNTNPIVLDDGGKSYIRLKDNTLYRFVITDSAGALIDTIDDIGGGGTGASYGSLAVVVNYDALRNLSEDYDVIIVLGRDAAADGGQGIFLKTEDPIADDDGISLVRQTTTRYLRELDGYIDPQWFGVQYNVEEDQSDDFTNVLAAATSYSLPILIAGNIYFGVNVTIPSGVRIRLSGSIYGPATPPTITFADGSILESCSTDSFLIPVHLGVGVVDIFRSSWLGGDVPTVFSRIADLSEYSYTVLLDEQYVPSTSITIPDHIAIDFAPGAMISIASGGVNIDIPNMIYNGYAQVIEYTSPLNLGAIVFGGGAFRPEWAGALGDGSHDDSLALSVAYSIGNVELRDKSLYRQDAECVIGDVTIRGSIVSPYTDMQPLPGISFGSHGWPKAYYSADTTFSAALPCSGLDGAQVTSITYGAVAGYSAAGHFISTNPGGVYRLEPIYSGTSYSAIPLTNSPSHIRQLITSQKADTTWSLYAMESTSVDDIWGAIYEVGAGSSTMVYSGTDTIYSMARDITNNVYIGTNNGIKKVYLESFSATQVTTSDASFYHLGIINNDVYTIYKESSQFKVGKFNSSTSAVDYICNIESTPTSMVGYGGALYVVQSEGNLLKVDVSTSAVSTVSTGELNTYWYNINEANYVLYGMPASIYLTNAFDIITAPHINGAKLTLDGVSIYGGGNYSKRAIVDVPDIVISKTWSSDVYATASDLKGFTSYIDTRFTLLGSGIPTFDAVKVDTKIHYQDNSTFKHMFMEDIHADSADITKVLAVDEDGLVYGTDAIKAKTVTTLYAEKMHIRFHHYQPEEYGDIICAIYRYIYSGSNIPTSGDLVSEVNATDGGLCIYNINENDPPFITFETDNSTFTNYIGVSAAPSNSDEITIAYTPYSAGSVTQPKAYIYGTVSQYNPEQYPLVYLDNLSPYYHTRYVSHGVRLGTKWSWG